MEKDREETTTTEDVGFSLILYIEREKRQRNFNQRGGEESVPRGGGGILVGASED